MSSELARRPANAAAPSDGDNRYKSVQLKLKSFAGALDNAADELAILHVRMASNAERTETLAAHIAHADLDLKFVELTNTVSVALGGAAVEVKRLQQTVQDTASTAHETQRSHSRMYERLDDVRSSRRERTPKPGFFERR
ncbi:conjugal transfer protein TraB [Streptomyces sp. NBC_01708]|uniref:conjugal transfer protein TraB n=1 Tax=Streptomyces sp. NBC_01708 TaxID=2975915 RepID=UPI002E35E9DB|nr:conjugal transfer protein TraB [Streptomyces sp. NBC_01708]